MDLKGGVWRIKMAFSLLGNCIVERLLYFLKKVWLQSKSGGRVKEDGEER